MKQTLTIDRNADGSTIVIQVTHAQLEVLNDAAECNYEARLVRFLQDQFLDGT